MRAKAAHQHRMQTEKITLGIAECNRIAAIRERMARADEAVRSEVDKIIAEHRANPRTSAVHDYGDYTPRRMAGDADEGD